MLPIFGAHAVLGLTVALRCVQDKRFVKSDTQLVPRVGSLFLCFVIRFVLPSAPRDLTSSRLAARGVDGRALRRRVLAHCCLSLFASASLCLSAVAGCLFVITSKKIEVGMVVTAGILSIVLLNGKDLKKMDLLSQRRRAFSSFFCLFSHGALPWRPRRRERSLLRVLKRAASKLLSPRCFELQTLISYAVSLFFGRASRQTARSKTIDDNCNPDWKGVRAHSHLACPARVLLFSRLALSRFALAGSTVYGTCRSG